ncbi:F0F1 ATP synthase subunit epsilon [Azotobacter vinelandii CA]|uniref:ATP synthase epsilon chain n=2 Tax=Azotobacter vinelandii TaxID=354 RepID=C1DEJ2_AZOVD|nr:F0F1 ATP synthase subunit epsilon [Azotobacter vinelandii]ACO78177.1 H+-transporting two-sector ATPase, delta/epsilon subunit [Azotobacter vinelandii DJ]AGK13066.1 F0F1 ATP synthase subunit epsilon [Azotobacter vinelandii CA]AGK20307.1 F0F1 ATP synthase subunit epsilon [Azotobacter vinelandii CA6]SFX55581.1 F-type H+-transporting ATPase subunit epsilon [Azotobacter vinelandii]GLK59935.1 ATP synthase epsilon chain 2 [Azotobacter vinelandii]
MSLPLRLRIVTPQQVLVDCTDVVAFRGEDASGGFGLLPGHVDYLTVLVPTVLRWRRAGGEQGFCAVHGGVLSLSGGELRVACREGIVGERLEQLEAQVREARETRRDSARRARVEHLRLHTQAVRQLVRYLRAEGETPFDPEGEPR